MFVTLLAENHARMIGNLRQMSFFDETRIGEALTYLSGFNEMQEGGLAELTKLLRREIQRRRISVLVIDGLVTAAASAPNEQAFKLFVHDLQEVALATDCTMFLTTNVSRQVSPEQTMVDGLITLSDRVYGWRAESDLQVTKFRGGGYLRGRHSYKISDAGIRRLSAHRGAVRAPEPRRRRPPADGSRAASPGSMPCWAAAFRRPPRRWSWGRPASARRRSGFISCRARRATSPD